MAVQAHAAAAAAILAANNKGKGPWELDLHGLHVSEAVGAVESRIDQCRRLQAANSIGSNSNGASQKLRVIVGRGNHSSLGEASLPRVVADFLNRQSLHYDHVGGVINVSLQQRRGRGV